MVGGGEYSFLDLVSNLPADWQVLAVAPQEGELSSKLLEKKVNTRIIPLPALRPWNIANVLIGLHGYKNLCRKFRPHLIYANGSRAALYNGLIGQILNIPVIWHCRIVDKDPYLDSVLCALSTFIITNSRATAKRFSPCISEKIKVVYNGVDLHWLKQTGISPPELIRPDWKIILMVARASKCKRHDLALSVFEKVATTSPHVHLICVGSKDHREPQWWDHLQHRTKRSPFSNRIHWIGQVKDIRPWYSAAHVLILPSDNESFGRVLVEAMACGVPVVTTRIGGVPEIVRQGQDGFLVKPDSVDEMVNAMKPLLNDKALKRRFVLSAQKRAEYFSLDKHMMKILRVFNKTIKKH